MCHTVTLSWLYMHMIYMKEKYCFSNIPGEDLLSLVTIVIAISFKYFFFFFNAMDIQHLVQSDFIQDHTSFSGNPYVQNQRQKSPTPSILSSQALN